MVRIQGQSCKAMYLWPLKLILSLENKPLAWLEIHVNKAIFVDMYEGVPCMRIPGGCCYITAIVALQMVSNIHWYIIQKWSIGHHHNCSCGFNRHNGVYNAGSYFLVSDSESCKLMFFVSAFNKDYGMSASIRGLLPLTRGHGLTHFKE